MVTQHLPTRTEEAFHELRWQTVKWALRHCIPETMWVRPTLAKAGDPGYYDYTAPDASPWNVRPARTVMDLREIVAKAKLWEDMINPDLDLQRVQERRVETWTTPMFEDLYRRAAERKWFNTADHEAMGEFRDAINYDNQQARLRARQTVLEQRQIDEIAHLMVNDAAGAW
jgi:hypothetical protein